MGPETSSGRQCDSHIRHSALESSPRRRPGSSPANHANMVLRSNTLLFGTGLRPSPERRLWQSDQIRKLSKAMLSTSTHPNNAERPVALKPARVFRVRETGRSDFCIVRFGFGFCHQGFGNIFGAATNLVFKAGGHVRIFLEPDFGVFTPLAHADRVIGEPCP
jgi:hypothetical protein